ncbi:MAG: DUF4013 domain-containing protein [Chloroflexi bacterium]|nr:DUF4013 domain-containing protein [Chloroflexota bacterium]
MTDSIDIGKALTHLFEDKDWISKTIIGGVLALIPVLNFVLVGYEVRVARNVSKREATPMPAWDDFGQMFMDGLWLGLARIIYGLPALVLIVGPILLFYFSILFAAILSEGPGSREVDPLFSTLVPISLLLSTLCCGVGLLYAFALGAVYPAIAANYARRGTFASCFNFGEVFGLIRRNPSNYLLVWATGLLIGVVTSAVISFVNFIPCLNLLLIWPAIMLAAFWSLMGVGHAVGQLLAIDGERPEAGGLQLNPAS